MIRWLFYTDGRRTNDEKHQAVTTDQLPAVRLTCSIRKGFVRTLKAVTGREWEEIEHNLLCLVSPACRFLNRSRGEGEYRGVRV